MKLRYAFRASWVKWYATNRRIVYPQRLCQALLLMLDDRNRLSQGDVGMVSTDGRERSEIRATLGSDEGDGQEATPKSTRRRVQQLQDALPISTSARTRIVVSAAAFLQQLEANQWDAHHGNIVAGVNVERPFSRRLRDAHAIARGADVGDRVQKRVTTTWDENSPFSVVMEAKVVICNMLQYVCSESMCLKRAS